MGSVFSALKKDVLLILVIPFSFFNLYDKSRPERKTQNDLKTLPHDGQQKLL